MLATTDWQMRASAAYQWTSGQALGQMRANLAERLQRLISRTVVPDTIFVDREAHQATVTIDGAIFRLRYHDLVLIRPCVECGNGHFESPAISELPDLGYALDVWQPRCKHCPAEDSREPTY